MITGDNPYLQIGIETKSVTLACYSNT